MRTHVISAIYQASSASRLLPIWNSPIVRKPIGRRLFIDDSFVCWFWNIGCCRLSLTAISLLMILFRGFQIIFCPPLLWRQAIFFTCFLHALFWTVFYDYTVIAGLITPGFSRHYARLFLKSIYELYHIINRPLNIIYHFYIFEIRIRGTTRSTLSDIFERTTSSAKHPHSSVYAHSARLARHAHYPPLSLLNQDQRNNQTTSPNRIPIWIFMEKVQDQRNIHITRRLPKQIHYDHIILSIVIF